MEDQILRYLIPASGLISGLIGAFVGLQNRALLAEVRKELAELENRIFTRINGTYVRSGECRLTRRKCSRAAGIVGGRDPEQKRRQRVKPAAVLALLITPCGRRARHRGV